MGGAAAGEGIGDWPALNDGSGTSVDGVAGDGASGLIVDAAPGGVSEVDSSGTAERDEGGAACDRVADKPRQLAVNTIPANPRWSIQDVRMIFSNNLRAGAAIQAARRHEFHLQRVLSSQRKRRV